MLYGSMIENIKILNIVKEATLAAILTISFFPMFLAGHLKRATEVFTCTLLTQMKFFVAQQKAV